MKWKIAIGLTALVFIFSKRTSILASNPSFDDLFKQYAPTGIDWTVLKRISWIESRIGAYPSVAYGILNPNDTANSTSQDKLSWGIMQLRPSTARDFDPLATAEKLNNPEYSIKIAAKYINWCRNYLLANTSIKITDPRFQEYLIKSYNQGVGRTVKEIKGIASSAAEPYWNKYLTANV